MTHSVVAIPYRMSSNTNETLILFLQKCMHPERCWLLQVCWRAPIVTQTG